MNGTKKNINQIIADIEKQYPVEKITCNEIQIWPLIADKLILSTINSKNLSGNSKISNISQKQSNSRSSKLKASVKYYASLIFINILKSVISQKILNLYFGRSDEKKLTHTKIKKNPFYDNWFRLVSPYGHSVFWESGDNSVLSTVYTLCTKLNHKQNKELIFTQLDEFSFFLKKQYPELDIDYFTLKEFAASVYDAYSVFELFFKIVHVKNIFFTVFFHPLSYALSAYCAKNGIKSIEIQHGQQGKLNPYYSFLRRSIGDFDLLPKDCWIWSDRYEDWFKKHDKANHTMISGNLALLGQMSQRSTNLKPVILFAWQPVSRDYPPRFIMDAIEQLDYNWLFRLHPRMLKDLSVFTDRFRKYPNIEIKHASLSPLYELLPKADAVVTLWSTVVYEGLSFGCKAIVVDEYGAALMEEDINEGLLVYIDNLQDFKNYIENDYNSANTKVFEQDILKIKENVRAFFEN